ncbi:MAG: hypothetical protein KGL26_11160, partial [Pseudomonadota bacterium]|nr:hypothetical protein [Pseudomonadota bacterium]
MRVKSLALGAAGLLMLSLPALAGPPFVTDDPEPVELGHWEVYGFSAGTQVQGDRSGTLTGIEVNNGAAPGLQLHAIVPLAFDAPKNAPTVTGLGDIELGAKYRFFNPAEGDWRPEVGMFPLIELPTGDAAKGLGGGHLRAYIPVWLQKNFGRWT